MGQLPDQRLQLASISARDPPAPPTLFDKLQLALVLSALAIDVLVLGEITGRITEYGTTPNKAAALGENIILLANLDYSARLLLRFIRRHTIDGTRTLANQLPTDLRRVGLDRGPGLSPLFNYV